MTLRAYYNEIDPFAAQWLKNLMAAKLIMAGEVDERSIKDVQPDDLEGFTRCHFFAGIAGWDLALQLAGWPDDRPVWTGSCPCQPFSVAGKGEGFDDKRHLWPEFRRLIAECAPAVVLGEQVAGASRWLNLVRGDLEALDYAVGAIPMEAASADADHFRDRYWFVADRDQQQPGEGLQRGGEQCGPGGAAEAGDSTLPDLPRDAGPERATAAGSDLRPLVDSPGLGWGEGWTEHEFRSRGFAAAVASIDGRQYLECPDARWRRLPPPGVRWLGTRIPARVAKLRAIGNAIDHRPAAQFIGAYLDCRP